MRLTGLVGSVHHASMTQLKYYLNTHIHFDIAYNGEQSHVTSDKITATIVGVNASTHPSDVAEYQPEYRYLLSKENIQQNPEAVFSYSVAWHHRPELTWENRLAANHLVPVDLEIHWLSIINSFVLVMLLTSFLSLIMVRILKRDFSKYMDDDEAELGGEEETGWKLVHADVFRIPPHLSLFTAFVGAGAQLFVMLFGVLLLSLGDAFRPTRRGRIAAAIVVSYAVTSGLGGYVSARLYRQLGGKNWVWNIVLCAFVVPGPLLLVFAFLNTVAIWNDSSAALPFGTIMILLGLFLFVALPLTIIGGIWGKNRPSSVKFDAPCRTNKIPREIPDGSSYRHPMVHILIAGCLPFSAVYIELHHIFAAIWGHQIYTLFGILFLSLTMLVVVTAFMTITLTYFQLTAEDYRWWWRSFVSGGITGLFVFLYSIWYYYDDSDMTGFFQTAFFFGYSGMMAYCFFIMLGFVGFQSSLLFVKKIYRTIKVE